MDSPTESSVSRWSLIALLIAALALCAGTSQALWYEDYTRAKRLAESDCGRAIRLLDESIDEQPRAKVGKRTGVRFNRIDYFPYLYLATAHLSCGNDELAWQALDKAKEYAAAPSFQLAAIEKRLPSRLSSNDSSRPPASPTRDRLRRGEVRPPPAEPTLAPPPIPAPDHPPEPRIPVVLRFGERLEVDCEGGCRFVNKEWHLEIEGHLVRLPSGPVGVGFGGEVVALDVPFVGRLDDDLEILRSLVARSTRSEVRIAGLEKAPVSHLLSALLFVRGAPKAELQRLAASRYEELVASKTLVWREKLHQILLDISDSSRSSAQSVVVPIPEVARSPASDRLSRAQRPIFVVVPGGRAEVGCLRKDPACFADESPGRRVLVRSFELAATETTYAQYSTCVRAAGCTELEDRGSDRSDRSGHPVVGVTWEQATQYCAWLGGRLPTEPEWERAARGSDSAHRYPWGASLTRAQANYGADQCCLPASKAEDQWLTAAPVASFPANEHRIYDLIGNVGEWTADSYRSEAGLKVVKGGSWIQSPELLRISAKLGRPAGLKSSTIGFRCARN